MSFVSSPNFDSTAEQEQSIKRATVNAIESSTVSPNLHECKFSVQYIYPSELEQHWQHALLQNW